MNQSDLGFNNFLLLSRGETKETGKARAYILANTFEALLGALYLDSGYEPCDEFVKKYLLNNLAAIIKDGSYKDSKSKFQEESQERVSVTPSYKVLKEEGPDHAKIFDIGLYISEELIATGHGSSKQEAEVEAAKAGLEVKNWQ